MPAMHIRPQKCIGESLQLLDGVSHSQQWGSRSNRKSKGCSSAPVMAGVPSGNYRIRRVFDIDR
jgi:hypothetical protein